MQPAAANLLATPPLLPGPRTMIDASPLTALTRLRSLQVWLGASHELPPCSNRPLRGLLAAVGHLTSLTELQLLRGLYLSWELRKIRHLDRLTQLQVGFQTESGSGTGCMCSLNRQHCTVTARVARFCE